MAPIRNDRHDTRTKTITMHSVSFPHDRYRFKASRPLGELKRLFAMNHNVKSENITFYFLNYEVKDSDSADSLTAGNHCHLYVRFHTSIQTNDSPKPPLETDV